MRSPQTSLIKLGLRYSKVHLLQSFLLIFGIALGVSVVVAIDIANTSVSHSFQQSTSRLTGKATHRIVGGLRGVHQDVYRRLRTELGFTRSAPVISGITKVKEFNLRKMQILGVDPLAEANFRDFFALPKNLKTSKSFTALLSSPGSVFITPLEIENSALKAGDKLTLTFGSKESSVRIAGYLKSDKSKADDSLSGLIYMDIGTAQQILNMGDYLSYIDLIVENNSEQVLAKIKRILPEELQIVPSQKGSKAILQMSKAFETNLTAFSFLALLVGMFLIYNTTTFSILQRRHLIGTLRAIGVTKDEIFMMILGENFIFSVIGALIGLLLGIGMGMGALKIVGQTVSELYFSIPVNQVYISPVSLIKGFSLGLLVSMAAAFFPALEAIRITPVEALRKSSLEHKIYQALPLLNLAGILLFLTGVLLFFVPGQDVIMGFGGTFMIYLSLGFFAPQLTLLISKLLSFFVENVFGVMGKMASRNIPRFLSRISISIASLMLAISVYIGVGAMIFSFRTSVINWIDLQISGDIQISSSSSVSIELDPKLITAVRGLPEIERVIDYSMLRIKSGKYIRSFMFITGIKELNFNWVYKVKTDREMLNLFENDWVFLSETFAWNHGIAFEQGSEIELNTRFGPKIFKVAGVFSDFFIGGGRVVIHQRTFKKYWDESLVTNLQLFLKSSGDLQSVLSFLKQNFERKYALRIISNREMKSRILKIFDNTFKITVVLKILSALVAFIGVLNTVLSLMMEREREIGVLRANGMTVQQLWKLVFGESALIGLISGILSIPIGIGLAWILTTIINKRSFGWTLEFHLQTSSIYQAILLSVAAALLAAIYPAYVASQAKITDALRKD